MPAAVHVVVCMDTEGPCADPCNPTLLATWEQVDAAMDKLFSPAFRDRDRDPQGGHLRFGWFFLTWTGFRTNPRGRAFGYHAVRDHYLARWGDALARLGDEQCWHYHQPAASGIGNEWGLDWAASQEYEAIISRQLLERDWFPSCFRAGGTIESPASSRWIDQWFPIDFSNRAPICLEGIADWSTGVAEWGLYHPSAEDETRPGAGRRRMARCLDLVTGAYVLEEAEVVAAFERARRGQHAVLSVFDHDYRDIEHRLDDLRELVHRVAKRYPDVPWRYATPVDAVRGALEVPAAQPLELDAAVVGREVWVSSTAPLYQSIPWLAVRTADQEVRHVEEGLIRVDERHWRWTPPAGLDWIEAGFGGSTDLAASAVVRLTPGDGPGAVVQRRGLRRHPQRPHSIWEHTLLYPRQSADRATGKLPVTDSVAQTLDLLGDRVQPGASLLDVGCASGHLFRQLPSGVDYRGIDPFERGIELGRALLAETGLPAGHLRALGIEELPPDERYDIVICLNTLYYLPDFRLPLEIMARATRDALVIRSSFAAAGETRYLADVLLEEPFHTMRTTFDIAPRGEVEAFLVAEGFRVTWVADRRQAERFGGRPEVVGGIEIPYEFLFAERISAPPGETAILGPQLLEVRRAWRERGEQGPNP